MENLVKAELSTPLIPSPTFLEKGKDGGEVNLANVWYLLSFQIALASIFLLAAFRQLNGSWPFETSVLLYLHAHATSSIDQLMLAISASVTVLAICGAIWLVYRRAWRATIFWLVATLGAELVAQIVKHFFHYERPHLGDVISHQASYGFPSGHATLSMAMALAFLLTSFSRGRLLFPALISMGYVLAVGLSRLYLRVHFPTDVLAGWLLAISWICAIAALYKRVNPQIEAERAV